MNCNSDQYLRSRPPRSHFWRLSPPHCPLLHPWKSPLRSNSSWSRQTALWADWMVSEHYCRTCDFFYTLTFVKRHCYRHKSKGHSPHFPTCSFMKVRKHQASRWMMCRKSPIMSPQWNMAYSALPMVFRFRCCLFVSFMRSCSRELVAAINHRVNSGGLRIGSVVPTPAMPVMFPHHRKNSWSVSAL